MYDPKEAGSERGEKTNKQKNQNNSKEKINANKLIVYCEKDGMHRCHIPKCQNSK